MEMGREPRLGDVAALAGVSTATVSRVLNNRGYLSQETRDRVGRAIAELNYRPNQVARSMLTQRTNTVGLIVPAVSLPFFGEVAVRIENELAAHGLRLLLCNSMGHADREREHLDLLMRSRVDGIISGAHNDDLPEYREIRQPVVTIDREMAPHIPNVRAANEEGGRLATRHLLERGSRRPALLTSRADQRNLRERGYRTVLADAGIEPLVLAVDFNTPEPERTSLVRKALRQHAGEFDAVFATDDLIAARAMEWAHSQGLRVPDDFRIVGFDGTEVMRLAWPALTTIRQPIDQICRVAVALLVERIDAGPASRQGVQPVDLPVSLIQGRTS